MRQFEYLPGKVIGLWNIKYYQRGCHLKLKPIHRQLLEELFCRWCHERNFASFVGLGRAIGCSKGAAEAAASYLRELGLISWESGSVKGGNRRANVYSIDGLLEKVAIFYRENVRLSPAGNQLKNQVGENGVNRPKICDGTQIDQSKICTGSWNNQAGNCVGGGYDQVKICARPAQKLNTNNIYKYNNKAAIARQPPKFYDKYSLTSWASAQPELKDVSEGCLSDFFEKMSDRDWVDDCGRPIGNMIKYILAWNKNWSPSGGSSSDDWRDPGDELRHDDIELERIRKRYGLSKTSEA